MKKPQTGSRRRYSVGTLQKGLSVLEELEKTARAMNIAELADATGVQRSAVFRLLCTLEERGYVERLKDKRYRSLLVHRRVLLGYCAPLSGTAFRTEVLGSLQRAAAESKVDLMVLDNEEDDPETGLRNAQILVNARVDLAMIFQPNQSIGHAVADCFMQAGIPLVTIERPIQGAVYFGGNNYQAGKLAGQELGRFAVKHWRGTFDSLVLIESPSGSTNVEARVAGVQVGVREVLGALDESQVIHLYGHLHIEPSRQAMEALLARLPGKGRTRMLISGFNDLTAAGALQAVRAAGREKDVAVVGQNATEEGRREICNPSSRFIASIAYFPEQYGSKMLRLALSILHHEAVPPAVFTQHLVIDRTNIHQYYPEPAGQ
jgi:ribose transport system substrate-binding protein